MSHNQLDLSSDSFDPLESIYGSNDLPDPSAPILDNVEAFIKKMEGKGRAINKKKPDQPEASTSFTRRFTADQMPVPGKRRPTKNIKTFMDKQTKGPFSALQKCVQEGRKIKVSTRKLNGVRGTCIGILVAFDKHWNLAMQDVDETYNRPRYPKPEALMPDNHDPRHQTEKMGESVIRVLKRRRNTELCARHVPQIVLRGEQVALVQVL